MKIKTCCLFLLFTSFICFSQSKGRIVYRVVSQKLTYDKDNDTGSRQAFVNLMNEMSKIRDSIALYLDFEDQESIFYVDRNTNIGLSNNTGYQSVIKSFNLYYRNNNSKVLTEKIISDNTYLVNSKTYDIEWDITNEKKRIGDYICFKATTNVLAHKLTKGIYKKHIEAWFCPDISISLGPKNYGGLPGLIIELKDEKLTYYVKAINLKPDFQIMIDRPSKGKLISKEDYFALKPTITRENFKEYIGD